MKRHEYSTNRTDKQWKLIEPLLPPPCPVGAPRQVARREAAQASRSNPERSPRSRT